MNVIAVFDIGKTNKKILLFTEKYELVEMNEEKFETITDDDGFECDDIERIEKWIISSLTSVIENSKYTLKAVNFSTYGATLVFLDENGKRVTPLYNYLKPVPENIQNNLFDRNDGREEFCRKTASPALGLLLNTGIQMLWLKNKKPDVFARVANILNFPQYLSYLLTNKTVAEPTFLGCHTFLWDFDKNQYHEWVKEEGFELDQPIDSDTVYEVELAGKKFMAGVGIHDSSASLVPYLLGVKEKFVLVSTGTWCVSMNPFNEEPLTAGELANNCLKYLSIYQKPVKSTMYFMGHIHDVNVERIQKHFKVDKKAYQKVVLDMEFTNLLFEEQDRVFFKHGTPETHVDTDVDLDQFENFDIAYHQFMYDLTLECAKYLKITLPKKDDVESLIVTGGFARNPMFIQNLIRLFPDKKLFTSEIDNATALGAAMVCVSRMSGDKNKEIDLGLKLWN